MENIKTQAREVGVIPLATVSALSANPAESPNLVFIHMSWGGSWVFKNYINFFAKTGYNCYALDLRGHNKSGGSVEGATMQDYVNDVQSVVAALGARDPIIIGHSMGGLIALMYSSQFVASATISLDGSPPLEVQKASEEKTYPAAYKPQDAGMPSNPLKAMFKMGDINLWKLIKMKSKLGLESGIARSEREKGISIPKEKLMMPLLFIGAQYGASLPFGFGIEKVRQQAEYYGAPVIEIKGASHPGLLIGKHWKRSAQAILEWLEEKNITPRSKYNLSHKNKDKQTIVQTRSLSN